MRNYFVERELLEMRRFVADARAEILSLKSLLRARSVKFSPDQPRVPAGQREGGQWTNSGGSSGSGQNVGHVDVSFDSVERSENSADQSVQRIASRKIVTLDYSRALTGISTIDNATKALSELLAKSMESVDFIPESTPRLYGTAVHGDFGARVKTEGIPGMKPNDVEQSFLGGIEEPYGKQGSIRTDVILRNDVGDPIAIYDVKTGDAALTAARVRELRSHAAVGLEVPIIELQVKRGATIKSQMVHRRHIGNVKAFLWNPMHRGNLGRAIGARAGAAAR